jgi:predicted permease
MARWSRLLNAFRGEKVNSELEEELRAHLEEAMEEGRDPEEARKAFGSMLRTREESRDIRIAAWLDALRADAVFGWRQLVKRKTTSAAAIVSLALAVGACTSAFRLIDALLLRPLPVANAERLYYLAYEYTDHTGKTDTGDAFEYPQFRLLREAAKEEAELMAISYCSRIDLTYGGEQEMEKAYRQYLSGWTMDTLGLRPALGRLLSASDDVKPGAHPVAVLSHDYWQRRFGGDPKAVGRTVRIGNDLYEIVGVVERGFTGTETGTMTDVFIPTMMNAKAIDNPNWNWFRTWVQLKPGANVEVARQKLRASMLSFRQERVKTWGSGTPKHRIEQYLSAPLVLERAAAGVSGMQKTYRRSLTILAVLVGLVLLIACANVANLMTAQATSRAREMALRVSIGAGRRRLVQLMLVESTLLALMASVLGGVFAWWSAPFVVSLINPPGDPARLALPADGRVLAFAAALALGVTLLFGMVPALRASAVKPAAALKGGEDPHARRRLMKSLVAAQVAFCFLVHFVAGLFVATFDRLASQPTGFAAEGLLVLETTAKRGQEAEHWEKVTEHLRSLPGVRSAALCGWGLMSGNGWSSDVWAGSKSPDGSSEPYFLSVSPGWLETMKIPLLEGRDFRPEETYPKVGIVNEEFARRYFEGQSPVGQRLEVEQGKENKRVRIEIVGYARDARYRNMRERIRPTVYVPFRSADERAGGLRPTDWGSFIVRTSGADPLGLAPLLRQEVRKAHAEFLVSNVRTQSEMVRSHTIRERMLAMLSLFFASVALLLAGVGLYGVLDYTVIQRQREIGIRLALGAQAEDIVRRVTAEMLSMLVIGSVAGLVMGILSERYFETLLYEVRGTSLGMLALPAATILAASLLAALPPVMRAVRIDPAGMLRAE